MREVSINISKVRTKTELMELIGQELGFPEYYGKNLDALYDCLSEIGEPTEVAFEGVCECRESSAEMEEYLEKLARVLEDVTGENENLTFVMIEESEELDTRIGRMENMETIRFRDLNKQYEILGEEIDAAIKNVCEEGVFIGGTQVKELERELAEYVGVKHCITCANGTDALVVPLMCWGIGPGDAVFVPDFTFFATGEAVSFCGATPIFIDVSPDTFNIEPRLLEREIKRVKEEGILNPRAVIAVDLFGLPASMNVIKEICEENGLYLLEDGAQGFGGSINGKMACSFGDISTTSFFPAKPLGCYGDGGAIFTDNDEWADLIRSICVHGKGDNKYDNVRIGMNSRLDSIQAAILRVKLNAFIENELEQVNRVADAYRFAFKLRFGEGTSRLWLPRIPDGYRSSYAQFTLRFADEETRDGVKAYLDEKGIPTVVYYPKPLHSQEAFGVNDEYGLDVTVSNKLSKTVLSVPMGPYVEAKAITMVVDSIWEYFGKPEAEENLNPFPVFDTSNTEYGTR